MNTQDNHSGSRFPSFIKISQYVVSTMIVSVSALGARPSLGSSLECEAGVTGPLGICDDGDVAMMSSGDGTRCVVTDAGHAKCWGRNDAGQLGRGDPVWIGDDESPGTTPFIDLGAPAREIHTNGEQTFALLDDGAVRAWGANDGFELGLGHAQTIGDDETPTEADQVQIGEAVTQLAVGADFACARLVSGAVRCWGANDFGQLGYGHTQTIGDDETPQDAGDVELGGVAVSVTAGAHHACALLDDGTIRCWGLGDSGQLGYRDTEDIGDDETPASAGRVMVGGSAVELVAGGYHTCARLESGEVRCWGEGESGQLGYGNDQNVGDDELPAAVGSVPLGGQAVALAAGERHTCAVLSDGGLRCWGDGDYGQLGYGNDHDIGDDETPVARGDVDLGSHQVSAVFSGPTASSTCVRLKGGGVRCWGHNDVGQLGYAHTAPLGRTAETEPVDILDVIVVDDSTN